MLFFQVGLFQYLFNQSGSRNTSKREKPYFDYFGGFFQYNETTKSIKYFFN